METKKIKEAFGSLFKKDKVVKGILLLGICGIALIYFSSWQGGKKENEAEAAAKMTEGESYEEKLEADLSRIVKAITGEDDPTVMITLQNGGEAVYAQDEKGAVETGEGSAKRDENEKTHIILKDSEGTQTALPVTELKPQVKGVVVVSRSAKDPAIREKLTLAVRTALDISSARVCVTDSG